MCHKYNNQNLKEHRRRLRKNLTEHERILWHYGRGGAIEQIHDRIKNDLAGGKLPSAVFGANAAWWRLNCMAWNMIRALQIHALPELLNNCHLKKLRLWLFNIAGRAVQTGRQVILRLTKGHPSFGIYKEALEIAIISEVSNLSAAK